MLPLFDRIDPSHKTLALRRYPNIRGGPHVDKRVRRKYLSVTAPSPSLFPRGPGQRLDADHGDSSSSNSSHSGNSSTTSSSSTESSTVSDDASGISSRSSRREMKTRRRDLTLHARIELRVLSDEGSVEWRLGRVRRLNSDRTYEVLCDDGYRGRSVKKSDLRIIRTPKSEQHNNKKGTKASSRRKKKANKKRPKKSKSGGSSESSLTAASDAGDDDHHKAVGDEVEARFQGKSKWYKGTIRCVIVLAVVYPDHVCWMGRI